MTNKYKVSDLAKDFKLASKDLLVIVNEVCGGDKKSGASLNEEEITKVFLKLTKTHEQKSFDAYFATGDEARENAKKAKFEITQLTDHHS